MKRKDFLKEFIILTVLVGSVSFTSNSFAVNNKADVKPLEGAEEFGSAAEIYKALSLELSPEEYQERVLQLKTYILKMQAGEVVNSSYRDFKATLQWMAYIRRRIMEIEKFRAEQFGRPADSAAPSRSAGKDGTVSYSGRHAKVLQYIIKNYSKLAKADIDKIDHKIQNTEGKAYKKGFSVTFNAEHTDELDNTFITPFSVTLKGANHFPEWSFAKQIDPVGGLNKETDEWERFFNTSYSWQRYLGWEGAWYAIGSKTRKAFGYATDSISEIYNATEGTITTTKTTITEMDLALREVKSLTREVEMSDAKTGIVGTSYREDREILEYHTRINDSGDIEYLPSLVVGIRYDNSGDLTTEFKNYISYDSKGRAEYVLDAETNKDAEGNNTGNKISAYKVKEYDPITGLTPYKHGSEISISDIAGDFLTISKYTDIAWRLLQDKDAYNRVAAVMDPEEALIAVALGVADMVVKEGYDYETAKINVISSLAADAPLVVAQGI
jgi:hypothetical protein